MPAGLDDTVPVPVPFFDTNSVTSSRTKLAVIVVSSVTVTLQAPVPLHAPPQPTNVEGGTGVAANEITVPSSTVIEHVAPHSIPEPSTVPEPMPDLVIVT